MPYIVCFSAALFLLKVVPCFKKPLKLETLS
jgi:hypothetical protein